jgi:hypothetical protein
MNLEFLIEEELIMNRQQSEPLWQFSKIPNIEESNFNKILERIYNMRVTGPRQRRHILLYIGIVVFWFHVIAFLFLTRKIHTSVWKVWIFLCGNH